MALEHVNLISLYEVMRDVERFREFLVHYKLIPTKVKCKKCKKYMPPYYRPNSKLFATYKCNVHQLKISSRRGTWFENCKLDAKTLMIITYSFAYMFSYEDVQRESSLSASNQTSSATVADWYNACREVCMNAVGTRHAEEGAIGGPGHIVEVDEVNIATHKTFLSNADIPEGSWLLGFIDTQTMKFRLELCPDNRREQETVIDIIQRNILPGSQIRTDLWKEMNMEHYGYSFIRIDGNSGNNLESQWISFRKKLCTGGVKRKKLYLHMYEYLWRNELKIRNENPFLTLLKDIAQAFPVG